MSHHYIEFKNVHYGYHGGREVLRGITFRINHGEKVGLIGPNGAGKSTLLLQTNGLLLPTEGIVEVGGIAVTKKTLPLVRQSVGMVFQNPDDQLFMPTVGEDVAFGPMNMKLPLEDVEKRVNEALRKVGCLDLKDKSSTQISGGQKRRVAIATILSMEPAILVLDEPTSNLDWKARENLCGLIESFMHTCLIASHDLGLIKKVCDRILVLEEGRLTFDGRTEELFQNKEILKSLGIDEESMPILYSG